ncbi:hypothetical protein Acr_10g0007510 [Actinidia rufa]|uniref:Uncharacterized protein n=1 Tax=Actinidia rufa TaxID=165716 RepID=A0A7J0FAA8_9ERIC|nr:hypothetical protein Acr_10g0007510 [Actinidia rufa]
MPCIQGAQRCIEICEKYWVRMKKDIAGFGKMSNLSQVKAGIRDPQTEIKIVFQILPSLNKLWHNIKIQYGVSSQIDAIREDYSDSGDMLRLYAGFQGSGILHALMDCDNNSYQTSIGTTEKIKQFHEHLKVAQSRQRVMLIIADGSLNLSGRSSFLESLSMEKCIEGIYSDPAHALVQQPIELENDLSYVEEPVQILDRREQVLRNKVIHGESSVENQNSRGGYMGEEKSMRSQYPYLIPGAKEGEGLRSKRRRELIAVTGEVLQLAVWFTVVMILDVEAFLVVIGYQWQDLG